MRGRGTNEGEAAVSAFQRVKAVVVTGQTATAQLACGHAVTLYRQVRGGRVAWATRRGEATSLSTKSRECAECAQAAAERGRGWTE